MVLKGIGGFYTVYLEDGQKITCTPRGRVKKAGMNLLAGDRVMVDRAGGEGTIEEILPRRTELYRPAIANVDQVVIVMAVKKPDLNLFLLDRLLVLAEDQHLDAPICLNKMDLVKPGDFREVAETYRGIGYRVLKSSALLSRGIAEIRELLRDKVSVVAGPSGAGKSTLLNRLFPDLHLKTADISSKLKRGRHTTRHVELIPLDSGGVVADTPGFDQLKVKGIPAANLPFLFPEIGRLGEECRFKGCLHRGEPGCRVREALAAGSLAVSRYDNYMGLLQEIEAERSY